MSEHYINSVEDYLIDGLSFKMPAGGSYVISRKNCTFYPAGSATYSSVSGTKLIRINLSSSSEWLDPQSVRLSFQLNNKDGTANHQLRTVGGAYAFFSRARLLAGGVLVEDLMDYSRMHHMFSELTSSNSKRNEDIESFGINTSDLTTYTTATIPGIAPNRSKVVCTKLLFGLLNQQKFLPMQYLQLTLELELDSNPYAAIIQGTDGQQFTPDNTSTNWDITDVKILADTVMLDSSLQNSYTSHLLEGKSLPINYTTFVSQSHIMTQQPNFAINIVRSFTRLKSLFINFYADSTTAATQAGVSIRAQIGDDTNTNMDFILKPFNRFYNPQSQLPPADRYSSQYELEWQVSIGSATYPVYPCRSTAESLYRLKAALGIVNSSFHAMDLSYIKYTNNSFLLGIDLEKICEVSFTGLNTKANDLITIKTKWGDVDNNNILPLKLYCFLCADMIMEIRDGGVTVFD